MQESPDKPIPYVTLETFDLVRKAEAFLLPIDKDAGYSSTFFVNQVRHHLSRLRGVKRFKVGHAGTLDPFATGVLVLLCGKATRQQDRLMRMPKSYLAEVRFGATSDTLDCDGEVTITYPDFQLNAAKLEGAIPGFLGEIDQIPPAFSAKWVDGQRAYDLARRGETVELAAHRVRIDELEVRDVSAERVSLHVRCGSGTYIRSLARDLGEAIGTDAYLTALQRTSASGIDVNQCLPFADVLAALKQARST